MAEALSQCSTKPHNCYGNSRNGYAPGNPLAKPGLLALLIQVDIQFPAQAVK